MTLEEVKRKVLIDLFASPGTLVPIVIGLSALMYSWAVGGVPAANGVGLMGILGGVGFFASRLVLGLEGMTKRAYEALLQSRQQQQDHSLDELERRLYGDQDHRTETVLRRLRELHRTFTASCRQQTVVAMHHAVIGQVEQIFNASVGQLRRSLELFQVSQKLTGKAQQDILSERERVIREVIETRDHLSITIEQFQSFVTRRNQSELSQLRDELDETLKVAQRTEERMAKIGQEKKIYDESEFE